MVLHLLTLNVLFFIKYKDTATVKGYIRQFVVSIDIRGVLLSVVRRRLNEGGLCKLTNRQTARCACDTTLLA